MRKKEKFEENKKQRDDEERIMKAYKQELNEKK